MVRTVSSALSDAICDAHRILPGLFCPVERVVRSLEELAGGLPLFRVVGDIHRGDAEAQGNHRARIGVVVGDLESFYRATQLFRYLRSAGLVGTRQQRYELLAAVPRYDIAGSFRHAGQHAGNAAADPQNTGGWGYP